VSDLAKLESLARIASRKWKAAGAAQRALSKAWAEAGYLPAALIPFMIRIDRELRDRKQVKEKP